jgi:hypothetical protein
MTPPRLTCDLSALATQLQANLFQLRTDMRRAFSVWFLRMLEWGFLTEGELEGITSGQVPAPLWHTVFRTSLTRLTDRLNALVRERAQGAEQEYAASLIVGIDPGPDPVLTLSLGGYCVFRVHSLHRMPAPIPEWGNDTLELISACLVPCLLPAGMWDGSEMGWLPEDRREEYEQLRDAGGLANLPAAAALVRRGEFGYFSDNEADLAAQLEEAREMYDGRPAWMESFSGDPVKRARELRDATGEYRRHQPHPWVEFVHAVSTELCTRFTSSAARDEHDRATRACIRECQDSEVPLSCGLWVDSGSHPEQTNAEVFFESMGNAGERPFTRLALADHASSRLWRILQDKAQGLGWLLRASAIDDQLNETT